MHGTWRSNNDHEPSDRISKLSVLRCSSDHSGRDAGFGLHAGPPAVEHPQDRRRITHPFIVLIRTGFFSSFPLVCFAATELFCSGSTVFTSSLFF